MSDGDPHADLHALTRAHRREHGCGAHTFGDGPGLVALVRRKRPGRVLELGCALGYTACCLSEGGPETRVDTVEGDAEHVGLARASIAARGLEGRISVHHGWFEAVLPTLPGPYDLAFFDGFAPSDEVVSALAERLAPGGTLVCANLGLATGAERTRLMDALEDAGRWRHEGVLEGGGTVILTKAGGVMAPKTARELGLMQGFPPPPEARPNALNWDLAPWNRWSFQNVRMMVPTAEVRRGEVVLPLEEAPRDLSGFRYRAPDGTGRSLDQMLERTYTDGFLVMHQGRVIAERYMNGMERHTQHLSQSVSKSLVGALAGVLAGEGLVDPAAPVTDHVPELAVTGYAGATLDQVLDMQSGVRFDEGYESPDSDIARVDIAAGWKPAPAGQPRPTLRDVILTLPAERPHGEAFSYRSIETDVVAWVLERAAGAPLAELMSSRIWQPIGAERDASFTVDAAGTALADGGFNATLRDYARFGEMIRNRGRAGGRRVVPEAWVESLRFGEREKFGPPYTLLSPEGAYRRQWWVRDVARGDIMARGVFGQLIYVDFDSGLTAVKLSTWPDFLNPDYIADTLAALEALRETL